jgi:hypothetical protein
MKTKIGLFAVMLATVAVPALAQNTTAKYVSNKTTTATTQAPAQPMINFVNQKPTIDSMVSGIDANNYLDHASFRGKAREGKYWVELFYSKANKEIMKANFVFTTDSLNFSRCYYFKNNSVTKIFDNNTTNYYQVGNVVLTDQGTVAPSTTSKKFSELIADTFQALSAGCFQ